MARLSDLQLILLSSANQREDGHLLPTPASVGSAGARLTKTLQALLKHSLASEAETSAPEQVWREEEDRAFGLVITDIGRSAVSRGDAGQAVSSSGSAEPASTSPPPTQTKQQQVLELLNREQGATLGDLTQATGWLPHTTRAALTGLRKKGHAIIKAKREDVTCYRVEASA
jgi:hypothetical protein